MTAGAEFGLLGTLLVRRSGSIIDVRQGKLRVVLAALLLDANKVVTTASLIDVLWPDSPPPTARRTTATYVNRLRDQLGDEDRSLIVTCPAGYLIRVDDSELDVSRFKALVAAAQTAARRGAWEDVQAPADAALALWRGEPLADVDSETLTERHVPSLTELRMQALEIRIEADLRLGFHARAAAELRTYTAAYPEREKLLAQLMLVLYWSAGQAEALAAYQRARHLLADRFGTEPGAALKDLQQKILNADPSLAAPVTSQANGPRPQAGADPSGGTDPSGADPSGGAAQRAAPSRHRRPTADGAERHRTRNLIGLTAAVIAIGIAATIFTIVNRPPKTDPPAPDPQSLIAQTTTPVPSYVYSHPEFCVPQLTGHPCLNSLQGQPEQGASVRMWNHTVDGNTGNTFWALKIKPVTSSSPFRYRQLDVPGYEVIELEAAPDGQPSQECISTKGAIKHHDANGTYYFPLTFQRCDQSNDNNDTWLTWNNGGPVGHLMTMVALTDQTGGTQQLTCLNPGNVIGKCARGAQLATASTGLRFSSFPAKN